MQQPPLDSIRDEYPFKSNFIKAGAWNMHYLDEGSGSPVLMLHGNPFWSYSFRNLVKTVSKTHRAIAPDYIGFGLSEKPASYEYSMEAHIDSIERLVEALDLDSITLIMHDWGGPIGMGFAVRHPQRIHAMVAVNSIAFSGFKPPLRLSLLKSMPWLAKGALSNSGIPLLSDMFYGQLSQKSAEAYQLPFMDGASRLGVIRMFDDLPYIPEGRAFETILEIEHGLWIFREHRICLLWGMDDWLFGDDSLEKWILYYPNAKLHRLPSSGRNPFEDAPEESARLIAEFIDIHSP